ncbi:hypothetical protein [Soonwooa sp.]|uniref:hypothetical protein n=1 Tax=Soonwooa sp. TaxID=1938592 RepID=UPI0026198221|nr:hypothetical protein [Soonwooa sp.]
MMTKLNLFFNIAVLLSMMSCGNDKTQAQQSTVQNAPSNNYHSTLIRDSIFTNVYQISSNNITQSGVDYLIDVAISNSEKVPVLFIDQKLPTSLLPQLYPKFSQIIVITPNWGYYDDVAKAHDPKIACAEPMASSIIYEFNRQDGRLQKDSLELMGKFPEMKNAVPKTLTSNERKIFYSESYGSTCCPKDPQWDNSPTREEFVADFEKLNQTKISETYREKRGKEGETVFYYTLKNLPNALKIKFIQEREYSRLINKQNKDVRRTPMIYTAFIIEKNERMQLLNP